MRERTSLPRIKVCGLRTPAELACALAAGCDAIGLVEHPPSPRAVSVEEGARLCRGLPRHVLAVAVLVDRSPLEAERFARACGAGAIQLCGSERASVWRDFSLPILRRVAVDERAELELEAWREIATGFVLDQPGSPGGSGTPVRWEHAAELCERGACLLAGGLDGSNVAAAITAVRPTGVDASSRLECAPGVKDPKRVAAFVRNALAAFEELKA